MNQFFIDKDTGKSSLSYTMPRVYWRLVKKVINIKKKLKLKDS